MKNKFDIIGAPFNHVGFVTTENNTVEEFRCTDERTWVGLTDWVHVRNSRWSSDIKDTGDVLVSPSVHAKLAVNKKEAALAEYCTELKSKLLASYKNGRIPITIGGDHSIAIGTVQAALEFYQKEKKEKVAVIWVDAHADCNDSLESNLHGKPLAMLMNKYSHNGWLVAPDIELSPTNVYYVAVRDLMPNEHKLINEHGIVNYDMEKIEVLGITGVLKNLISELEVKFDRIYMSFDYDALDGSIFRACATPNVGGLSAREAITLVHTVASHPKFIGADFVEYLPELDATGTSKELMVKLVDAVWGFRT